LTIVDERREENGSWIQRELSAFISLGLSGYLYILSFYQALDTLKPNI